MKIVFAIVGVALGERLSNSRSKRQNVAINDTERAYDTGSLYDNSAPASTYDSGAAAGGSYGSTGYEATGLKCWHCDAMSFEECETKGQERSCHANQVVIIFKIDIFLNLNLIPPFSGRKINFIF